MTNVKSKTMDKSKIILRCIFVLGIWSFFIMLKFNDKSNTLSEHFQTPMVRRYLLQRQNRYIEPTSTTSDGASSDDVLVDNRQGIDEETLVHDVESRIPSLPLAYWNKNKVFDDRNYSSICGKYPSIFELEFNNIYWQTNSDNWLLVDVPSILNDFLKHPTKLLFLQKTTKM
ncbi:hypothetical protein Bhyg_12619 [Pseudolycoriella hygida]|uniref:Uncharacterized protein n=1 Tax=Pseudolycoriella hygida TaxID=35572 RepID=A0A9Q0S0K4_9DIPT|nr:hypothetical protein Bhyg_12619 [Pseudolycoriella hygida]